MIFTTVLVAALSMVGFTNAGAPETTQPAVLNIKPRFAAADDGATIPANNSIRLHTTQGIAFSEYYTSVYFNEQYAGDQNVTYSWGYCEPTEIDDTYTVPPPSIAFACAESVLGCESGSIIAWQEPSAFVGATATRSYVMTEIFYGSKTTKYLTDLPTSAGCYCTAYHSGTGIESTMEFTSICARPLQTYPPGPSPTKSE